MHRCSQLAKNPTQPPQAGFAYIYVLTHIPSNRRCVGCTIRTLEARWARYWQDARGWARGKYAGAGNAYASLFNLMHSSQPSCFAIDELEQCPISIKRYRELDYMRALETWNPTKGFNDPRNGGLYLRHLCFLLHPPEKTVYLARFEQRKALVWQDSTEQLKEFDQEQSQLEEKWEKIGTDLLPLIHSLCTPVVTFS